MAPTICMTEDHVLNRSPSFCRRTFKLKRDGSVSSNNFETTLQNNSSGWRLKCPRDSSMPLSRVKKRDESQVLARRKGNGTFYCFINLKFFIASVKICSKDLRYF